MLQEACFAEREDVFLCFSPRETAHSEMLNYFAFPRFPRLFFSTIAGVEEKQYLCTRKQIRHRERKYF